MIDWVDMQLKMWADMVRGGLPGLSTANFDSDENKPSRNSFSVEGWQMECVVQALSDPFQGIVKIHYLPEHYIIRERVQAAARFLGDTAPGITGVLRGTVEYRQRLDETYQRQHRRYYRVLHQAHEVIGQAIRESV